ncbi:MAG: hypothetical protein VX040_00945, partial [Pseudomonadota bacterium]|nr:hypothetical protein [Pseudomonadota bacterium]
DVARSHLLMVMRDSGEVMPIAMVDAAVEEDAAAADTDTDTGTAETDAADATAETNAETTN